MKRLSLEQTAKKILAECRKADYAEAMLARAVLEAARLAKPQGRSGVDTITLQMWSAMKQAARGKG
jgi:hypothetical protein